MMKTSGDIVVDSKNSQIMGLEEVIDTQDQDFPEDEDIFEMVEEVNLKDPLPDITQRYFTSYYRMNFPQEGHDICIRMHTNRICLISLAPSHALFNKDRKIVKIDFQVTDKLNRANNSVSGKAKHGAQPLHESSKICTISCDDGESWVIRCGINGKLTEANTDLLTNPELLREPPHRGGYLAIVLPKINDLDKLKKNLVTQEVYDEMMRERRKNEISSDRSNGSMKRLADNDLENIASKEKITRKDVAVDGTKMTEAGKSELSPT
ncbi:protein Abitram [Venturia canescens]|uniref:protein Abitram n=1 Tax=Venturia canescens TaxID=32260 RepID=UPI001C9CE499|nr:protein Abitram [Venturia canescens]XP_043268187.1 protein Abitram [Venturia canescens]